MTPSMSSPSMRIFSARPGPDRKQHSVVIGRFQEFHIEIFPELDARPHADSELRDPFDFPIQDLFGKTVFRYPVTEHAAEFRHLLVDGDVMAQPFEEIRGGQTLPDRLL